MYKINLLMFLSALILSLFYCTCTLYMKNFTKVNCILYVDRDLSTDEGFPDELKTSIRFLASVLLRRLKKVLTVKLIGQY